MLGERYCRNPKFVMDHGNTNIYAFKRSANRYRKDFYKDVAMGRCQYVAQASIPRRKIEITQLAPSSTAQRMAESAHTQVSSDVFNFAFPKGVSGRITRRDGGFDFDVEIADERIEQIMRIGDVPEQCRLELKAQLRGLLLEQMHLIAERNGPIHGWMTRQQLRNYFNQFKRLAAKGVVPDIPSHLIAEMRSLEYRRREGLPYPSHRKAVETIDEILRLKNSFLAVDAYITQAIRSPEQLHQLLKDILIFLRENSQTARELDARRSAFRPEQQIAIRWSFEFWTGLLARGAEVTKKQVAFCDAVLRLSGLKLKPETIQKHLGNVRVSLLNHP